MVATILPGAHGAVLEEAYGRKFVRKHPAQTYESPGLARKVKIALRDWAVGERLTIAHRDKDQTGLLNLEAQTLREWRRAGIPCPEPIFSGDDIITPYLDGESYYEVVRDNASRIEAVQELARTQQKIRALARERNERQLLHSDPHLNNFLYVGDTAYAIDPGVRLDRRLCMDDADAGTQLFLLHNLAAASGPRRDDYLEAYLDSFEHDDLKMVVDRNKPFGISARLLYALRDYLNSSDPQLKVSSAISATNTRRINQIAISMMQS